MSASPFSLESKIFSFGIISDPQYVDADDGHNYSKTVTRRYRQSLSIVKEASAAFRQSGTICNMVLGDTIDGRAKSMGLNYSSIEAIFDATGDNYHYILGNHDYYNFDRSELKQLLIPPSHHDVCEEDTLYYNFSPYPGYRFIILDGYDESIIGASNVSIAQAAEALVCEKNPNYRAGSSDWFNGIPLENYRYVPYNGGVGQKQFQWLSDTLDEARANKEKCVIFCHQPICVRSSREANLLWNAEDILELLHREENSHVVAFLSGHDHDGGYWKDTAGIHHLVPPAPLECSVGEVAYGVMDVHPEGMRLNWTGKLPPLCVGREGSVEVRDNTNLDLLLSEESRKSVNRAPDTAFLAVSTPCVWPEFLTYRHQLF